MIKREQRRYRRIPIDLPARITINAIDDYDGRLLNISPGDMALQACAEVQPGDAAVVAIADLDVIEGRVARIFGDGFAMSFLLSRNRRKILLERLMLHVNPSLSEGLGDRRGAPRHNESGRTLICRLPDGSSLLAKAINRSVDGIAVESNRKPPVGSPIHVGRMRGLVLRHTPRGFVVIYEPMGAQQKAQLRAV
ncbi:MAG: PilZ domain-containing protein [Pseudomonadota bacterium]